MTLDEMRESLPCVDALIEAGPDQYAVADTAQIPFDPSVRKICETGGCGSYGRNYGCPPFIGTLEECEAQVRGYSRIFLFRKAYPLEDSFDFEGMQEASRAFRALVYRIRDIAKAAMPDCLILGAGGCGRCEKCAALTQEPCRFPEKRTASLEGCGMIVSELAARCGLKYISGADTVTFFGGVLFHR